MTSRSHDSVELDMYRSNVSVLMGRPCTHSERYGRLGRASLMCASEDDTVHVWYNARRPRWAIVVHRDGAGSVKVYPDISTASFQMGGTSTAEVAQIE